MEVAGPQGFRGGERGARWGGPGTREGVPGVAFVGSAGGVGLWTGVREGNGAVGGSAESSDAPWSSGPKALSPARAARVPAAPSPRTHSSRSPRKPLGERLPHPQKLPLRAPCGPTAPPGRTGRRGGPDVGGLLCRPTRLGRLLLEGQRQDKASWTRGTPPGKRRPPIPPRVGVGGGAWHAFGKSREIGHSEGLDEVADGVKERRMLANAALACLSGRVTGRPAFPCNRLYLADFASVYSPQDVILRFFVFRS